MPRGLMRSAALDSANLGWAATAAALVAIGGVTLPASALLAVVLLAQASIGDRAMRRVRWWAETEWHERLLLRIVAGAVVATAVDQVARALLGPGTVASAAWWIVALAASVTSRPAAAASPAADGAPPTDWAPPWRQWIWLALVACVIVAHEVLWTVETAIALGLLGTAASDSIRLPARGAEPWRTLRQPVAVRGVLVAAAVAVAWWGIDRRPPVRLLPDDRFFARVVWSLGEWGWTSNPFAIGEPFRYHWGSYAWLGLLARSSGAGAEASIRTVGPMAVAIVVALGLVALARRCGVPAGAALVAAGIAAACDTYAITGRGRGFHIGWVESFSQLASIPFVILAVLVLARIDERPRVGDGLIVGVLVLAAGAVKVSAAAVIVAAVCGSVAWAAWRRRRIDGPPFAAAAGAVIAGAIAAWRFSEPIGNTALGSGIVRPYWPVGFIGDLWRWYVDSLAKWTVVMVLLLAALVVAIPLASAGMRSLADRAHARAAGATLLAGTAAGLALTVLMPPSDNPFYALQNVVVIAWIVVAVGVVDGAADAASAPRGSLRAAAGVGAGVVVGLVTVLGDLERSDPDQILWIYVARPAIPALTAAILAIPLIARHRRIDGVVLRPVMLLLTGASVTLGLLNWRDQRSSDYREWARASAVAPDPAETDLLEWIAMTPPETVVASASDVVRDPMPRRELVPLVTTIQGYGREPLQRASVAAASGPGCVAASELVAAGADVFVATTEEASVGALDACATRVYENASYVVYDLAKAP